MADEKISQLNNASPINGSEQLPVVQSGTTFKTTINAIKTFFDTIYTTTSAVASQITSALSGYVNTGGLTTNYIPKASDSDTLANSQIFDNGTNVGINVTPTARLHVKGSDSTSANFAAKFDNSSNTPLLHISNDGNIGVGTTTPDAKISFGNYYINSGSPTSTEQTSHIKLYESGGNNYGLGVSNNFLNIAANQFGGNIGFFINGNRKIHINSNGKLNINQAANPQQNIAEIAITTPNSTAANYSIYIENNSFQPIFLVENNGNVNIPKLSASQIVETDANKNLISAAKGTAYNLNLGTTAGTVLEGNRITQTITNGVTDKAPSEDAVFDALALKKNTILLTCSSLLINPADSTTYYFGALIAPTTTDSNHSFKLPSAGIVKGATIIARANTVSGSTENNTINFRNVTQGTSTLISNTVKTNASTTQILSQAVSGLNISFAASDEFTIEWITPAYATNPQGLAFVVHLEIEKI